MQIDYVITWVDGQDPKHKAARKFYLGEDRRKAGRRLPNRKKSRLGFEQATKTRFQDNGEVYYNIASVLLYAPFIHKIFIVTDGQRPKLLQSFIDEGKCKPDFLQFVSHDAIFANDAAFPQINAVRPSFNSRSIEAVLWRIPALSEHFIFSNDDFFLNAPLRENDFFTSAGAPKFFGRWKSAAPMRLRFFCRHLLEKFSAYRPPPSHGSSLWLGAKESGGFHKKFLSAPHCPHPLRKSVFADFFRQNPQILARQLSFRFRSARQFNPVSLANHLEMRGGALPARPLAIAYLDEIKSPQHYADILQKIRSGNAEFGCIQDMGLYPPQTQAEIHRVLAEKFSAVLPEAIKQHILAKTAVLAEQKPADKTGK